MSEKKVKEKKEKKKINPMMLMMVLLIILILGLAAGVGYVILNQKNAANPAPTIIVESSLPELPAYTHLIEKDFVVNLTDIDAKRYVKLNISLGFNSVKLEEEFKVSDAFVRDIVISILSEKKSADFTTKGKEDLKKEFMDRINQYLKDGKISDIYFNDILVQ